MEGVQVHSLSGAKLKTIDCIAQSLAVGPVFSAVIVGFLLSLYSGGVGPLAVIITTIGTLGIGWVVSELAKKYSGAGTIYEFIAHTLGKPFGVFGAGLYHLGVFALAAVGIPIIMSIQLHGFLLSHAGWDIPWWILAFLTAGAILGINAVGIEVSVKTQLSLLIASLIPVMITVVAVIADGGPGGNSLAPFKSGSVAEGGSVFRGVLFGILLFVGFELSAALGEETEHPKKSIPTAVLTVIGVCGALYVITAYAAQIGFDPNSADPVAGLSLITQAETYVGRWLSVLVELAVIFDILAVGVGFCAAGARGLFALSRDGLLPRSLSKLSANRTPLTASITVFGVGVLGILLALIKYKGDAGTVFNAFLICSRMGGFVVTIGYLLLCIGGLVHFGRTKANPISWIAGLVGLTTAVGVIYSQYDKTLKPLGDEKWGLYFSYIAIAVLIVWLGYLMMTRKDKIEAAGDHVIIHD